MTKIDSDSDSDIDIDSESESTLKSDEPNLFLYGSEKFHCRFIIIEVLKRTAIQYIIPAPMRPKRGPISNEPMSHSQKRS